MQSITEDIEIDFERRLCYCFAVKAITDKEFVGNMRADNDLWRKR